MNVWPTKSAQFLSLKWKALFLLSIVLTLVTAAFYSLHSASLRDQFNRERDLLHERNSVTVRTLINQSAQQLLRVGELLPALPGVRESLLSANGSALTHVLDENSSLQLGQAIDVVAFYDTSLQATTAWGDGEQLPEPKSPLIDGLKEVLATETANTQLHCAQTCMQYAMIPILADARIGGVLLLGSFIANITVEFKKIAGADIGIITPTQSNVAGEATKYLNAWHSQIVALTPSELALDVLQRATTQQSLALTVAQGVIIESPGLAHEVRLLPISGSIAMPRGYVVIVHDVTAQVMHIRNATRQTLLVGVLGLLISEGVLLLLALKPLARLRQTAAALPLLAHSAFDGARAMIGHRQSRFMLSDELDQLDNSAIALTHQLEELEDQVSTRNNALAEKMLELTHERDFVRNLLATAQVIVVTMNAEGKILQMNRFGEELCGQVLAELSNPYFTDIFHSEKDPREHRKILAAIAHGGQQHLRHETSFDAPGGMKRHIEWIHSHLGGENNNNISGGPMVLSVGLDVTERKRAEQRISWLADHDSLTGLFNRRRFQEEFENIVEGAVRYSRPGALMFIDLDHFKYINDTRGHRAGDAVIKEVAKCLAQMLRSSDRLARLGGDEFAVVMPELGREEAVAVARKVNDRLSMVTIPGSSQQEKISSSIGVVLFPDHGSSAEELLANADLAMYQAKDFGRSRWHLFAESEQARERIKTQMLWKQRIEDALATNRFHLHYQPIANVQHGTVSHYEVLLRMRDEAGVTIFPSSFISIAERVGLIKAIDHFVLRKTVASLEKLPVARNNLSFSLNLSAHAFSDPELLPLVEELLASSHIDPHRLIFEITETAALADFEAACSLIRTMQGMGCKFAIDDFGVGFSSFYYLKQLPVEYIKIDGSFIQHLARNHDDQVLVKAMGEIARGFGKKTVAEYVEDAATLALLKDYKIDYAQGFYVGKPAAKVA